MLARRVPAFALLLCVQIAGCTSVTTVQQSGTVASMGGGAVAQSAAVQPPAPDAGPPADVGKLPEMNHTYRGYVPFLGRETPLPAGDWTVIAEQRTRFRTGPSGAAVVLMRRDGNVLTGLFRVAGNKVPRETATIPVSDVCTGGDVIWSDPRSAPDGAQDCAAINFARPAVWREGKPSLFQSVTKGLDFYGITPPPIMIAVAFLASNERYSLLEQLWLNPDLAGIAPDLATYRSQSGWAAFNLSRDPAKQAYVDRLKSWTEGWRAVVTKVIEGGHVAVPPGVAATP